VVGMYVTAQAVRLEGGGKKRKTHKTLRMDIMKITARNLSPPYFLLSLFFPYFDGKKRKNERRKKKIVSFFFSYGDRRNLCLLVYISRVGSLKMPLFFLFLIGVWLRLGIFILLLLFTTFRFVAHYSMMLDMVITMLIIVFRFP
jgi:hypothetical protein